MVVDDTFILPDTETDIETEISQNSVGIYVDVC